jgi:anti-sigma B factor antagonist
MKYAVDKQEKYILMTLNEDNLNALVAQKIKAEFKNLEGEGIRNFILDLSNVKFTDSSGLSAILIGDRIWRNNLEGSFIVAGPLSGSVKKLIEISKLDEVFTIIPTVDESIEYVFMEEVERELAEE